MSQSGNICCEDCGRPFTADNEPCTVYEARVFEDADDMERWVCDQCRANYNHDGYPKTQPECPAGADCGTCHSYPACY